MPHYHHICWYVEYLATHCTSPASISNAVSHLRTFYQLAGLPTRPLYHYRVGLALRAIAITIRNVPNQRSPVSPAVLKAAFQHLASLQDPNLVRLAVLLMYIGFLRQSSICPQSIRTFDPTRHLSAGDVVITHNGLRVQVKWTKTIQSAADATALLLPPTKDPLVCPVKAYRDYQGTAPPPGSSSSPLLRQRDGNPLTLPHLRKQWALLLAPLGLTPATHTLHSLRKGAAQFTYNKGKALLNDVMLQGTWKSAAVRTYIKPNELAINSVHKALSRL